MTGYFYSCGPDNQVTCGAEHLMVSHFYGTVYAQSRATTSNNSGAGEDNANGWTYNGGFRDGDYFLLPAVSTCKHNGTRFVLWAELRIAQS